MNDIIPPKKRPLQRPDVQARQRTQASAPSSRQPAMNAEAIPDSADSFDIGDISIEQQPLVMSKQRRWKKVVAWVAACVVLLGAAVAAIAYIWYQDQLKPVNAANTGDIKVSIVQGMSPEEIGTTLKNKNLIKSEIGFEWYLRVTRSANNLQAGTYSLSQSMSLPDIVDHLKSGKTDRFRITFLPGATVADNKLAFEEAGFSKAKVEEAFGKQYDHPVFKSKPISADLEGYIYGETYEFSADVTVEEVLERTFDELQSVMEKNDLESAYKKQGLSLYEGITLASIVQREVSGLKDQQMVAGVFYNRMEKGMNLGSDVTYQYIADKEGLQRDPGLESEYNTRIHPGLPPGPIAAPGKDALLAVARPIASDYLFFLSGDDGKTYFGRNDTEHQQNIEQHCKKKCQIL